MDAIRAERRDRERTFREPLNEYIHEHTIETETENRVIGSLWERTVDITDLSQAELDRVAADFPSGNFLYHGSGTEQLIQILDTGVLANTKALQEREPGIVRHNSGYEGISWSMNGIDALPGDRYHLAGFVAAPEAVLRAGYQLAIPSRPSPNEVILIDDTINAKEYYSAKTQLELYEAYDRNSVLGGLLELDIGTIDDKPAKLRELSSRFTDKTFVKSLRDGYSVGENGRIVLNPDLLSATDEVSEIPVAAVWLQGLVDTGRLSGTDFDGLSTAEVISRISAKNIKQFYAQLHIDADVYRNSTDVEEHAVFVPVERMYLIAPKKDAAVWMKVLARSPHKPAGILLYDDKKVRLENFGSHHRGDHVELTAELQAAIRPDNKNYIDYNRVLGTAFRDDMRTGHTLQVIAEKYLNNRAAVKKIAGKLVVER